MDCNLHGGRTPDRDNALPIQPLPLGVLVAPAGNAGRPQTAISRIWRPGDIPHCRLCPTCTANPLGFCLVVAPGDVSDRDAALFRASRLDVVGPPVRDRDGVARLWIDTATGHRVGFG
jgi:hypothetical protein